MHAADVTYGQTVRVPSVDPDRLWTVLDRHPRSGHWWLADAATGDVSVHWHALGKSLRLVEDSYRNNTVSTGPKHTYRVREWYGSWAIARALEGVRWKLLLANPAGSEEYAFLLNTLGFRTKAGALEMAVRLTEAGYEDEASVHENLVEIAGWYSEFREL